MCVCKRLARNRLLMLLNFHTFSFYANCDDYQNLTNAVRMKSRIIEKTNFVL